MAQDYTRLLRPDLDKMNQGELCKELFNLLSTAPATKDVSSASDGWFIKANESGSNATYAITLAAGGDGWAAGQVVSGSGTTYRVAITNGPTVTATVPRVLQTNNQAIPAGAKAIVIKLSDGTYRLIVAVWIVQTTS